MIYSESLQSQQRQQLMNVLKEEKFTDCTLIIGPQQVRCEINRLFLASISAAINELLFEDQRNEHVIPDIDPIGFRCILNFACANDPELNPQNVLSTLHICKRYKISSLLKLCQKYFQNNLCGTNVFASLNEAVRLEFDEYISECLEYLKDHKSEMIIESEDFVKMNLKSMRLCLRMDEFVVHENIIWERIIKSVEHGTGIKPLN